ncbi:hypothetical protein [Gordonia hongkongensis]|uniref:hypothetical protein n=1 Tax=Gordonia hongkongensis TaxID=1701090 RepID=UPI003EC0187D
MRKFVAGLAIGGSLTFATATTLLAVDSESPAASPSVNCGPLAGSGPIPGCSYRVDGTRLQISLYNNATRNPGVECTLTPSGAVHPTAATTMGPGSRGVLTASVYPNVPRTFVVHCLGGGAGADRVDRQTTIAARAETPEPARTTPSVRRTSPAPVPSAPSTSSEPEGPAEITTTPPTTEDAAPGNAVTTTTTTTTVPASS